MVFRKATRLLTNSFRYLVNFSNLLQLIDVPSKGCYRCSPNHINNHCYQTSLKYHPVRTYWTESYQRCVIHTVNIRDMSYKQMNRTLFVVCDLYDRKIDTSERFLTQSHKEAMQAKLRPFLAKPNTISVFVFVLTIVSEVQGYIYSIIFVNKPTV